MMKSKERGLPFMLAKIAVVAVAAVAAVAVAVVVKKRK